VGDAFGDPRGIVMTTTERASSPRRRLSFAIDVKPLFREGDREAMRAAFDLWSLQDVRTHGAAIAARLKDGSTPCDGRGRPRD
jgi:hypothetical protein